VKVPIYWVDAFTDHRFTGNPAAVCVLDDYLDDDFLQAIATENNLSETAFLVADEGFWHIRWFTPGAEVDLCGHATLASAAVISRFIAPDLAPLVARVEHDRFVLDFPSRPPTMTDNADSLAAVIGERPEGTFEAAGMHMAVMDNERSIVELEPDLDRLVGIDCLGLIVTAPGREADFVSRFFAPSVGVAEDPVTGSAHCLLVPYWSGVLQKEDLIAYQLSRRGGVLYCRDRGERVEIGGGAVHYLEGTITV
jgi:predicted PhzF superfamily epimerase YddE/YHI9